MCAPRRLPFLILVLSLTHALPPVAEDSMPQSQRVPLRECDSEGSDMRLCRCHCQGFVSGDTSRDEIEEAVAAIEGYRREAEDLRALVTDGARTQFVVVSIATALSAAESVRLVEGLDERGVAVRNIVVNQLLSDVADAQFIERTVKAQEKCLADLRKMSVTAPLKAPGNVGPVFVKEVPFFDTELQSVYALRSLSAVLFQSAVRK